MLFAGYLTVLAETQRTPEHKEVNLFYDVGGSLNVDLFAVQSFETQTFKTHCSNKTQNSQPEISKYKLKLSPGIKSKSYRDLIYSERLHRYDLISLNSVNKSKKYVNLHKDVGKIKK